MADLVRCRITRLSSRSGINAGASWSPDGKTIALTLAPKGDPDIYAISRAIDEINKSNRPTSDDAMMWNFPAARDVLQHLAKCYKPLDWSAV